MYHWYPSTGCWLEEKFSISWTAHSSLIQCYLLAQFASFRLKDRCILSGGLCVRSEIHLHFLGKEPSFPRQGRRVLSHRWLWLRAAAIGNVRSLAKVRCSLSRCDASCLWVAAPFYTLGSRRAIGHNRHEGNEAKVADDLRDEQTKKRLYIIICHVLGFISELINLPRHVKLRPETYRVSRISFFLNTNARGVVSFNFPWFQHAWSNDSKYWLTKALKEGIWEPPVQSQQI